MYGNTSLLAMAALLRRALGLECGLSPAPRPCLLLGQRSSGKTPLLLAAAMRAAAEEGRGAVFLARSPLQRLPGGARDPLSLKKIHFIYPRSTEELLKLIVTMHENRSSPSLIILDGLDDYLNDYSGQQMAAQLLALLVDTAAYFTDKLSMASKTPHDASCCCHLIVSMRLPRENGEETEGAQDLSVIERYFPERCWLEPDMHWPVRDEQADGIECYYRARFSGRQSEVDTDPSRGDEEWRLGIGSDGAIKIYPMPVESQHQDHD